MHRALHEAKNGYIRHLAKNIYGHHHLYSYMNILILEQKKIILSKLIKL